MDYQVLIQNTGYKFVGIIVYATSIQTYLVAIVFRAVGYIVLLELIAIIKYPNY